MVQFYPRWFTNAQATIVPANRLIGPVRISPVYHIVVAINDDTIYASSFVNLATEPVVLTIPQSSVSYSLLTLDAWGNVFQTSIPAGTPGTYALTGPGWNRKLPRGVTQVKVPFQFSVWIFRADRFVNGVDMTSQARQFRRSLLLQTLRQWKVNHAGGATKIVPEIYTAVPIKQTADAETRLAPILFLKQLQRGVNSPDTPPLTPAEKRVADRFDALFGDGNLPSLAARAPFARAVRDAHSLIVNHYLSHTNSANWIHFTNIGEWGNTFPSSYLDRDAITEYCQYCNNHSTAAYYHSFKDRHGAALDGSNSRVYVLRFRKDQIPKAKRFWSLTAYLPSSVELVPNSARKYVVASYTPGLKTNHNGSISIYMSATQPHGVPAANWLPVPGGKFNVMLRVYGPEGNVADNTYVPPGIKKR